MERQKVRNGSHHSVRRGRESGCPGGEGWGLEGEAGEQERAKPSSGQETISLPRVTWGCTQCSEGMSAFILVLGRAITSGAVSKKPPLF